MCLAVAVRTGLASMYGEGPVVEQGAICSPFLLASERGHGLSSGGYSLDTSTLNFLLVLWTRPAFSLPSVVSNPQGTGTQGPGRKENIGISPLCYKVAQPGRSTQPWGKLWLPPSVLWGHPGTHPVWCWGGGGLLGCSRSQSGSSYTAELEVNTELP